MTGSEYSLVKLKLPPEQATLLPHSEATIAPPELSKVGTMSPELIEYRQDLKPTTWEFPANAALVLMRNPPLT